MIEIGRQTPGVFKSVRSSAHKAFAESSERWLRLCENFLPFNSDESRWRISRATKPGEPTQGWKLHVSATVLQACDVFEKVAPLLVSRNARFKAPASLAELIKINAGLDYGYWQVGKFLTIYPSTETEALELARKIHELTKTFVSVSVPFDERFAPGSLVFYRYGAFEEIAMQTADGRTLPAIKDLSGELVYDNRFQAVPAWIENPFPKHPKTKLEEKDTPLMTTYKVFRAITQRGKGGTYEALDISTDPFRLCVVKEGRRHGEVFWNGQDGYSLVENEFNVLRVLGKINGDVPRFFSAFEAEGNFYFAMEYVEGKSLFDLMKIRQRRFSIKQVIIYSAEIAKIIEKIHKAGWIWNDCKPANLIVTLNRSLRPVDFENAYRADQSAPFNWRSRNFSKSAREQPQGISVDLYALGAVIYFLLTGKIHDSNAPTRIEKLRPATPKKMIELIEKLLNIADSAVNLSAMKVRKRFQKILDSYA